MTYTISTTAALKDALARVHADQEAELLAKGKCDGVQEEITRSEGEAQRVRERQGQEELKIALAGARMPDEPLPEELELTKISRHTRILRLRLKAFKADLAAAGAVTASSRNAVKHEWAAIAARCIQKIPERYGAAIEVLAIAYAEYRAWYNCFRGELEIKHPNVLPLLPFLEKYGVALDGPKLAEKGGISARSWQVVAADAITAIAAMQAEIDATTGRRGTAPIPSSGEDE